MHNPIAWRYGRQVDARPRTIDRRLGDTRRIAGVNAIDAGDVYATGATRWQGLHIGAAHGAGINGTGNRVDDTGFTSSHGNLARVGGHLRRATHLNHTFVGARQGLLALAWVRLALPSVNPDYQHLPAP